MASNSRGTCYLSPVDATALSARPARSLHRFAVAEGVTAVDPAGDAAEEGLQRGDLIMSINRQAVTTPAQVTAAVDAARKAGRTSVLLLVKRGPGPEAFVGIDIAAR